MKTIMVRYKVKSERAEENIGYIQKVFAQLKREMPLGLRYASFKQDDGMHFVHMVSSDDAQDDPLGGLSAFKDFVAHIQDRCEEQPVVTPLHEVGSYRSFSDLENN